MNTYPTSSYDDLGKVILSLGIGEAIVTVMNERGAPTPVAWTRLRAPESLMGPADPRRDGGRRGRVPAAREVRDGGRPRLGPRDARRASSRRAPPRTEAEAGAKPPSSAEDPRAWPCAIRTRAWSRRSWARPRSDR